MLLGTLLTGEIAKSALVAYVHYLGIILCFGYSFVWKIDSQSRS